MKRLMLASSLLLCVSLWTYAEEPKPDKQSGQSSDVPSPKPDAPALTPQQETHLKELIGQLGDDDWQTREKAETELAKIGVAARPYLEKTAKENPDPEIKMRTARLLQTIADSLAKEIVLGSFNKMKQTKGFNFTAEITTQMAAGLMNGPNAAQTMKITGQHQNPDLTYIKLESAGENQAPSFSKESYQKGDKDIAKNSGSKEWAMQESSAMSNGLFNYSWPSPDAMDKIKDCFDKVKCRSDETVDKTECQVIEMNITAAGLKKLIPENGIPINLPEKGLTLSNKIWIGKKDNLIYKMMPVVVIDLSALMAGLNQPPAGDEAKMKIIADFKFFDYDKDVEIKVPEEVKKLLEPEAKPQPAKKDDK